MQTTSVTGDFNIEIPQDFEKSKFMLFVGMDILTPIVAPLEVDAEWVYTATVGQNSDAFYNIESADGMTTYTFDLVDNGSVDSGIMIGNSDFLNSSSTNYFTSGSIVLLFADGKLYTRDASNKTFIASYAVGERVNVKLEADIKSGTYISMVK